MNHKHNVNSNDPEIIKLVNSALELLKSGSLSEASGQFFNILKKNYSNQIAESGIKCCKYWIPRLSRVDNIAEGYSQGKALFKEWKKFERFLSSFKSFHPKVISNLMYFIFNLALELFKKDIKENRIIDLQIYFLIGLSYKKIGDFNNAILYFEETLKNDHLNSNSMAQLADCYALIDEEKKAKVLFREAFFIDPSSIELDMLDSNIIHTLVSNIRGDLEHKDTLSLWIPVYGRALGIFNIKRELIPVELGKLKQEIFHLEQKMFNEHEDNRFFRPKLLNCYFWLYDYLLVKKSKKQFLTEIEDKIKFLSDEIYKLLKHNDE